MGNYIKRVVSEVCMYTSRFFALISTQKVALGFKKFGYTWFRWMGENQSRSTCCRCWHLTTCRFFAGVQEIKIQLMCQVILVMSQSHIFFNCLRVELIDIEYWPILQEGKKSPQVTQNKTKKRVSGKKRCKYANPHMPSHEYTKVNQL